MPLVQQVPPKLLPFSQALINHALVSKLTICLFLTTSLTGSTYFADSFWLEGQKLNPDMEVISGPQISLTFPVVFSCLHHHSKLKENAHRVSHYKTQQQTLMNPIQIMQQFLACLKKNYLQQRPFPISRLPTFLSHITLQLFHIRIVKLHHRSIHI